MCFSLEWMNLFGAAGWRIYPGCQGAQEDRGFDAQAVCRWSAAALQQLGCLAFLEEVGSLKLRSKMIQDDPR